ncbi:antitoxin Xre/MbcA/ParS toxin-binding domain-containing protein [Pseudomonas nitroreducens]|uniref:MbcA/ParS/Xre antitoxin family protein n=1 Tax=Pseudomonas nitroreducens TaxID=46680 RepID=UPI0003690E0E|nr:MbcA/ParS/Xre antitoxin family protein [Pseudomonas nitroreducens]
MEKNLETVLCSRYPKLLPAQGHGCIQLFGCECQDGWFGLIYAACDLVQQHIDHTGSEQAIASQIKEKFGGLRFYHHGGDDYVTAVVDLVEQLSVSVCELCGGPGCIRERDGWLGARCQRHEQCNETPPSDSSAWLRQGESLTEVLEAAIALFAFNPTQTSRWLVSPARAFDMKSPIEQLQEHNGFRDVMTLIGRIEHGVLR